MHCHCKRKGETSATVAEERTTMREIAISKTNCGNKGHISRVCRIKGKHTTDNAKSKWRKNVQQKKKVHQMDVKDSSSDDTTDTELALHVMTKKEELSHICLRPKVEGKILEMELDTGAAVSLISRELYNAQLAHKPLCTTDVILKTYTGEVVSPVGVVKVKVKLNKQKVPHLYSAESGLRKSG